MNPFAEKILTRDVNVEDASNPYDEKDATIHKMDYARSRSVPAIVTEISEDYSDRWTIDLYERGYVFPNGTNGPVTRSNVIAHSLHNEDRFEVGDKVEVHLMPDSSAWIVHEKETLLGTIMDKGPNDEDNFTNQKYWVGISRIWNRDTTDIDIHEYPDDAPDTNPDDPEGTATPPIGGPTTPSVNYQIVEAENLAEYGAQSHNLKPQTPVVLEWAWDLQDPPQKRYFFNAREGEQVIKITSYETKGGTYRGVPLKKIEEGYNPTLDVAMNMIPVLSTVEIIYLNLDEMELHTHWLATGSYVMGASRGSTYPLGDPPVQLSIFVGSGGSGRTNVGKTLPLNNSGTASTLSWNRGTKDHNALSVTVLTGAYYDLTGHTLHMYSRTLLYDARGVLISASSETKSTIDALVPCGS